MLKRKTERMIDLLCFIAIHSILLILIPYEKMTPLLCYQFIGNSIILTALVHAIYTAFRNHTIKSKIYKLQKSNNFALYLKYTESCFSARPNLLWIQYERLVSLAICGEFSGFIALSEELRHTKIWKREKFYTNICAFQALVAFFQMQTPEQIVRLNRNSYLNMIVDLIQTSDLESMQDSTILHASQLYNSPFFLFKSFGALVLMKSYFYMQDFTKQKLYAQKSLQYAPSAEVKECLQKQIDSLGSTH